MAATSTALASSDTTTTVGELVTFTATVTGTGTPTGVVIFEFDGVPLLSATLVGGIATASISTLSAGTYSVVAEYLGTSPAFDPSTSPTVMQTVDQATTSTALTFSPNPSTVGELVTFTATVTEVPPVGPGNPTGVVAFFVTGGLTLFGTLNAMGVATASTSALPAGTYDVIASYFGTDDYVGSGDGPQTQVVAPATTSTTLTSSLNPSAVGAPVTFTATVTEVLPVGPGNPTGIVVFDIDGIPTLTGTLDAGGIATATISTLIVGAHPVIAHYLGNTSYIASDSTTLSQVVSAAAISTTLTAAPATIGVRTNGTYAVRTLSATLTETVGGAPVVGKTITFTANPITGPVMLGSAVTNGSGVATVTNAPAMATLITASQYTATFAGMAPFSASSANAALTFQPLPFIP